MNDQEFKERIKILEEKVEKVLISSEKMRKYFLWTLIITLVAIVVPLIGLAFAIPSFLASYSSVLNF